jgi:hypothetical protein
MGHGQLMTMQSTESRAAHISWAAREVLFVAKWLASCEWQPPLEDVERVVHRLNAAARICSLDGDLGDSNQEHEHAARCHWIARLEQEVPQRPNLLREIAMFTAFTAVFAPVVRAGEADATNLRRLGLLAARVLTAAAEDYKATERHQERGR